MKTLLLITFSLLTLTSAVSQDLQPITLKGTLRLLEKNGSTYFAIQTEQPVFYKFEGKTFTSQEVQILGLSSEQWTTATRMIGETLQVRGKIGLPETRYHLTPIVFLLTGKLNSPEQPLPKKREPSNGKKDRLDAADNLALPLKGNPAGDWFSKGYSFRLALFEDGRVSGEIRTRERLVAISGNWEIIPSGRWQGYVLLRGKIPHWYEGEKRVNLTDPKFEAVLEAHGDHLTYIMGTDLRGPKGVKISLTQKGNATFTPLPLDL